MSKSRWTKAQLRDLEARGLLPKGSVAAAHPPAIPKAKEKVKRPETPQITEMRAFLALLKIPYVAEHRFHTKRNWRFDLAIPEHKLGFEYEGIFSEKSRHTTYAGYSEDAVKYNAAALLGWRVFRYTSKNVKDFKSHIVELLNIDTNA